MPAASAFQFFTQLDGLAITTQGFVYEWSGVTTIGATILITPLGLSTQGLVVGKGDFWQFSETIIDPNWTYADL